MKFTVTRKIGVLIVAALAGMAVSSYESWTNLARVFASADYANTNSLPGAAALAAADRGLHNERIDLYNHIAARDAATMGEQERTLAQSRAEAAAAFATYEKYLDDEQDKALLANDRQMASDFEAIVDKALALSKEGKKEAATALLLANDAIADGTDAAINAHQFYANELATKEADAAAGIEHSAQRNSIIIALVTVALIVFLGITIVRSVVRPLHHAVEVLGAIGLGRFDSAVHIDTTDEAADMLHALVGMQGQLRERTEREREAAERERVVAAENARIRVSLDKSSTGTLIVDPAGSIIYANESLGALLRARASDMRQSVGSLVGQAFGALAWLPAQQRDALARASSTFTTDVDVGEAHLRLTATPVTDAQGQRLGTAVQWVDRTDEVRTELEIAELVKGALAGDLTVRTSESGKEGFFAALAKGMNSLLESTGDLVRRISVAASEVAGGADEIARGNANLSQRTEEQAASLEQTASSMEQMTSTVRQTADNASQANQLAITAREQAARGGEVVTAAISAMGEISGSSRRIADIINVIDEIAFQTNLLALNAAVEAARAGEQGRGFAVVASEVRALAGRSAAAAREIKTLIQDSVGKVELGSTLVDQSGRTLGEIVTCVKKVTDIVAEIASASAEQADGVEQVNKAVTNMDEVTQQNAALVEEVSAAAENLRQQSASMRELLAGYKVAQAAGARAAQGGGKPASPRRAA